MLFEWGGDNSIYRTGSWMRCVVCRTNSSLRCVCLDLRECRVGLCISVCPSVGASEFAYPLASFKADREVCTNQFKMWDMSSLVSGLSERMHACLCMWIRVCICWGCRAGRPVSMQHGTRTNQSAKLNVFNYLYLKLIIITFWFNFKQMCINISRSENDIDIGGVRCGRKEEIISTDVKSAAGAELKQDVA